MALKRPGRIDVALDFQPPAPDLRLRLLMRWHEDIRAGLDLDAAVDDTAGYSFAEMEELRNLLIMRFAETDRWDWTWALDQFAENREDLQTRIRSAMGFTLPEAVGSGTPVSSARSVADSRARGSRRAAAVIITTA